MILKVRQSDGKVVARFPTMADAAGEAGHVLVDEATITGSSAPGCRVQGGAIVADLDLLTTELVGRIDADAEQAKRTAGTDGAFKQQVYAAKAGEVHDYRNVVGALLATLTVPQRRVRFPYAMAEVDLTGESLAVVIARFETGALASRSELARIEALAQRAKRSVRSATTAAAKEQAANVSWGT